MMCFRNSSKYIKKFFGPLNLNCTCWANLYEPLINRTMPTIIQPFSNLLLIFFFVFHPIIHFFIISSIFFFLLKLAWIRALSLAPLIFVNYCISIRFKCEHLMAVRFARACNLLKPERIESASVMQAILAITGKPVEVDPAHLREDMKQLISASQDDLKEKEV